MKAAPSARYLAYLATAGKRLTRERQAVSDLVFRTVLPFTRDELLARLEREGLPQGRRVSRSTVFRCVAELQEAGLIKTSDSEAKIEFCDDSE